MMIFHRSVSLFFIFHLVVRWGEPKAVNHTMRYFVFAMSDWEAESVVRQSRQQQGSNNVPDYAAPAGLSSNVVNILTGLFRQDVRPIVSGSTAFIPEGGLRNSVTGLLFGIAPTLQQILFGDRSNIPATDYTIITAPPIPRTEPPTSPRPVRQRTPSPPVVESTPDATDAPTTPTPEEISEEETEATVPTETSSTLSVPVSSSAQPSALSIESEEETEAPTTESTSSASAVPAATSVPSPEVSEPATQRVNPVLPDSPQVQREPAPTRPSGLPDSPPAPASPSAATASQLKVILEDPNSIVTANVINSADGQEKKYIYLVLLPEQYEQFNKLEMNMKLRQAEEEPITVASTSKPNPPQIIISPERLRTRTSPRPPIRNRNRTTTSSPPHLQLQFYYHLTSTSPTTTTSTTTTAKPETTDLPGITGFEEDDDELEN